MGLVNKVVSSDRIDECVGRWIEDVLRCAPLSVSAIKEAAVSATLPLEQAFGTQYEWEARRSASADAIEGPLAFVAKRDPVWTRS